MLGHIACLLATDIVLHERSSPVSVSLRVDIADFPHDWALRSPTTAQESILLAEICNCTQGEVMTPETYLHMPFHLAIESVVPLAGVVCLLLHDRRIVIGTITLVLRFSVHLSTYKTSHGLSRTLAAYSLTNVLGKAVVATREHVVKEHSRRRARFEAAQGSCCPKSDDVADVESARSSHG